MNMTQILHLALRLTLLFALSGISIDGDASSFDYQTWLQSDHDIKQLKPWAEHLLADDIPDNDEDLLRLHTITGNTEQALASLRSLQQSNGQRFKFLHYELVLRAGNQSESIAALLSSALLEMSDLDAWSAYEFATYDLTSGRTYLDWLIGHARGRDELQVPVAMRVLRQAIDLSVYTLAIEATSEVLTADQTRRFHIQQDVLIHGEDGVVLSAMVVRKRHKKPQATALEFTIYANPVPLANLRSAIRSAAEGYVGVVGFSRGKRSSPNPIAPYEHEVTDVNTVIDWISEQPWSDGQVGMYGGSYNGFSQWAALKNPNNALKTIVPYVAAMPGQGLPMENNVFLMANYAWPYYVSNNSTLDNDTYYDSDHWNALRQNLFESGRPFRQVDAVEGPANPWLQKWLAHPSFDEYWQSMVPFGTEYERINIPVLSITGYYDDGQISALQFLNEHLSNNPAAPHYLVIGPYDHFGAQGISPPTLRGYTLDEVAPINTPELTYQWLNHVLKGAAKPDLIKARVNYQRMGDNQWHHADSLNALNQGTERWYLQADQQQEQTGQLRRVAKQQATASTLTVDFTDRGQSRNNYYPYPIISDDLEQRPGLLFTSAPMQEGSSINGQFSGNLVVTSNKRDFDFGITLYEVLADGRAFHLAYYLGRASYAASLSERTLLEPGVPTEIAFTRTRMVSKKIADGSRIAAILDINFNAFAQVNYGTGGDVSDESISDADEPLKVMVSSASYIDIPVQRQ